MRKESRSRHDQEPSCSSVGRSKKVRQPFRNVSDRNSLILVRVRSTKPKQVHVRVVVRRENLGKSKDRLLLHYLLPRANEVPVVPQGGVRISSSVGLLVVTRCHEVTLWQKPSMTNAPPTRQAGAEYLGNALSRYTPLLTLLDSQSPNGSPDSSSMETRRHAFKPSLTRSLHTAFLSNVGLQSDCGSRRPS